jgi:hypothetical protein
MGRKIGIAALAVALLCTTFGGSAFAFGRGRGAAVGRFGGARAGFVHAGPRVFRGPVGGGRYFGRRPYWGAARPWVAPARVAYPVCGYYDQYGQWVPYRYDAYGNAIPCSPYLAPGY